MGRRGPRRAERWDGEGRWPRVVVMEGDVRWRTADKVGGPRLMGLP